MLSPDPMRQAPGYSQNYDGYAYAFNNPLKYTDPSGYLAYGTQMNSADVGPEYSEPYIEIDGLRAPASSTLVKSMLRNISQEDIIYYDEAASNFYYGQNAAGKNVTGWQADRNHLHREIANLNKKVESTTPKGEPAAAKHVAIWSGTPARWSIEWWEDADGNIIGFSAAEKLPEKNTKLDAVQYGMDVAGIIDPSGTVDLVNASIYAMRGQWLNAGISAIGIVAYAGDVFKLGRLFTKRSNRAFFSGAGAEARAIAEGFETLGQTKAGKNLQKLIDSKNIPWEGIGNAEDMWKRLSAAWAKGVPSGRKVHVFLNNPRHDAIWFKVELPILQQKGVNIIYR